MADTVTLLEARTEADLEAVRALCWAYRDFLLSLSPADAAITQAFYPHAKYSVLMDQLAEVHARPKGVIFLAVQGQTPVGCGMSHALDAETSEIKRVFVTEAMRGHGVAARTCRALEAQARADGFARIVLDTSVSLLAAQNLYRKLGFQRCAAYQPVPKDVREHLVFFEKLLAPSLGTPS